MSTRGWQWLATVANGGCPHRRVNRSAWHPNENEIWNNNHKINNLHIFFNKHSSSSSIFTKMREAKKNGFYLPKSILDKHTQPNLFMHFFSSLLTKWKIIFFGWPTCFKRITDIERTELCCFFFGSFGLDWIHKMTDDRSHTAGAKSLFAYIYTCIDGYNQCQCARYEHSTGCMFFFVRLSGAPPNDLSPPTLLLIINLQYLYKHNIHRPKKSL